MAQINENFIGAITAIAKEFLTAVTKELDPHTSKKGEVRTESNKVFLLTPSHIQFAKYGRGPGKNPPLDPLLRWVKARGIKFDGASERGTAFAIQKKIAKEGTSNWVPGAPNALEEAIGKNIEEYNRKTNTALAVRIESEVQKIYKEISPEKINYKF